MKKFNANLLDLVSMLSDGKYHDGTTIGLKLDITRSAIWKAIKKLQSYGVKIHSVQSKGYKLSEHLALLDEQQIKRRLKNKEIVFEIVESLGSTNDYLKTFFGSKTPRICLAEHQTQGKGRLNRVWHSPFAQNTYLSCLYSFQKDISELAGLSLVVSLAIIKTLKSYKVPSGFLVKWPNDVVYLGKKLAGILIELQAEANGSCHAIIGIGINVNMLQVKKSQIDQAWISLQQIIGAYVDRNKLCAELINNLLAYIKRFEADGFSKFMQDWKEVDYLFDKPITLKCIAKIFSGKAKGINPQGNLLLQLDNGSVKAFSSGDTSLMKK
jgi:BirA family biotin operon repressor/biotin-[acetyl-CoA-carboxylase] ligase